MKTRATRSEAATRRILKKPRPAGPRPACREKMVRTGAWPWSCRQRPKAATSGARRQEAVQAVAGPHARGVDEDHEQERHGEGDLGPEQRQARSRLVASQPFRMSASSRFGRAAQAVEGQHDGQGHRHLGRRDHDHEDREDLALQLARAEAREGHQVEVGRVQDQLDAHEHVHGVAPGEHAEDAQREERRGDDQDSAESLDHAILLPPHDHGRADEGHQQQDGRGLEGQQVLAQEERRRSPRWSAAGGRPGPPAQAACGHCGRGRGCRRRRPTTISAGQELRHLAAAGRGRRACGSASRRRAAARGCRPRR